MHFPTPDETILGLIAANAQHGYQILRYFQDRRKLGRVWNMCTSQVYAVLNRLEKNHLIQGTLIPQEDAPPKKRFTITPAGEERLHAWLYEPAPPPSIRRVRVEFLSRLYIADLLGLPANPIIQKQQNSIARRTQRIENRRTAEKSEMERTVSDFILGQLQAADAWLEALQLERQGHQHK
jgi:DNA-binding PadR family transcriptional regulator